MPLYLNTASGLVRLDTPRLENPPVDPPVEPPVTPKVWDPTQLSAAAWTRPTTGSIKGHPVVTWESLVGSTEAARQAASPSTPTLWTAAQAKAVTGGVIVSFPAGVFESENGIQNYRTDTNRCAFGIGAGYATGIAGYVGAGCRSTPGQGGAQTTLRMRGTMPNGTPKFNLITCNGVTAPYFAGFNLHGKQTQGDGVFHEGLVISVCPDALVERMTFVGVSPGYNSFPPGETFIVNLLRSDRAVVRDCELDGRDLVGNPTCASWGWNTGNDAVVQRVWYHDGAVGMLTFWETVNITSEDYWVDRVGYTTAVGVSGSSAGINHEQSEGTITHTRPHLFMKGGRTSGTRSGSHLTMHSANSDVGATMRIIEPDFEPSQFNGCLRVSSLLGYNLTGAGRYNMTDYATRYGYQYMKTNPTIIKDGKSLTCSPQFLTGELTGDPKNPVRGLPVGGNSGWNTKDPKSFYVKTNG